MGGLRERIEADLAITLEGEYGLPVELISPDGEKINTKKDTTEQLVGQILYDTRTGNPDTGEVVIDNNPIVTLRRSSLSRIPKSGEKWSVKIPIEPKADASLVNFVLTATRSNEGGASIGFIRLYLQKAEQQT